MLLRALSPLLERRVPRILGVYLGGSWAVVQFIAFLTRRYLLSPNLVTFALVTLALFIPSVCLLAWFHGAPGDDDWTREEMIGVSTNLVVALVVLYVTFGSKDLGAVTTTVSVTDEEGDRVEREVPKAQFRKKVALFYFDNETGDASADWIGYALPDALETDLDQDLFVRVGIGYSEDLQARGFEDATGAPMALKRRVARRNRRQHFLSGSILASDSILRVRTELRETESGDLVKSRTYEGTDVRTLADSISIQLRRDLEVPAAHLSEVEDLPVAELTTASPEAFRAYGRGYVAHVVRDDLDDARESLERAVSLDPTFALAQWMLSSVYLSQNRSEEATAALSAAMEHIYKLPLRYRFRVKDGYYTLEQQPDKRLSVARMRVEFYPEDVEAHLDLADLYRQRDRLEDALREYRRVLEIDPGRHEYRDLLGDVLKEMGRYAEARAAYLRYAEHFPKDADPLHELGMLSRRTGDHDSASAYFERAHLLRPENVDYMVHLGRLGTHTGDFEAAMEWYGQARQTASTPSERAHVLEAELTHHVLRGEIREALEIRDELVALAAASDGPAAALLNRLVTVHLYAEIGQGERSLRVLDQLRTRAQFPLDRLIPLGHAMVAEVREDPAALEEHLPEARAVVEDFGIESVLWSVLAMEGKLHAWRGECERAVPLYEEALAYNPGAEAEARVGVAKARCHRALGQLETAEAEVRRALEAMPALPDALHEAALLHRARGDTAEAVRLLDEALRIYESADSGHVTASEVRALHRELTGS